MSEVTRTVQEVMRARPRPVRVVSIMEADFVTGPAKNLLEFAQRSALPADHLPTVDLSIIAYLRGEQDRNRIHPRDS